jgi:hypothetical protein
MQIRVLAIFKLKTLSDWPQKFPAFQLFAPIYAVPRFFEFGSFYNTTYICDKKIRWETPCLSGIAIKK